MDLAAQVGRLKAAGAVMIVLERSARYRQDAQPQRPSPGGRVVPISSLFNSTLNSGRVSQACRSSSSTRRALSEVIANPSLYGFVNATARLHRRRSLLLCNPSTLINQSANLNYVFSTDVHPTTGAALLVAQAIVSMITGPMQMAALGEAPMDVERANWRTLDNRMMSAINAPGRPGKIQTWAAYDYTDADIFGTGVSTTDRSTRSPWAATCASATSCLPACSSATPNTRATTATTAATSSCASRCSRSTAATAKVRGMRGATIGVGSLDYSTNRNIALGATTRTETGTTGGYHNVARLLGGYWFRYQDWNHGPFAKLTYEKIVVRQFSENGNDSTALTYGQQKVDATWSSLGGKSPAT